MKRRQALHTLASAAAALPLLRVPLEADELTADQVFVLRDVAATVLPSAIGRKGQDEAVDNFLRWIRDYKEGVPLSHGYGEPRLVKIRRRHRRRVTRNRSPHCRPRRRRRAAGLARCRSPIAGRSWTRPSRPPTFATSLARPDGKHVVADLMAHYFRSSGANDLCYNARIGRHTYRAIRMTTVRPQPLNGGRGL